MTINTLPKQDRGAAAAHAAFTGSVPEHYHRCLGPFLFEEYARDLARRVRVPAQGTVLEVACGTGISTRALRAALPESVAIVATDLNEAMLDHARRSCADLANVRFEPADAQALPFDADAFDAVTCQFGLMFLPDKVQGLREVRRVLRPDGTFVANTWQSIPRNPVIATLCAVLAARLGEAPGFYATPFGYHDEARIAADCEAAGFAEAAIENVRVDAESPSARELATGFVSGTPAAAELAARSPTEVADAITAVALGIGAVFGDGPLRASLEALVVAAR